MSSPIQYTSRTFNTIMADINSDLDLVDKPDWWKRIWAGVGDVISVYNNAQANQSYLETAFTREAIVKLCRLIDYELSPRSSSSGILMIDILSTASFPKTVAIADVAGLTKGSTSISAKRFEGRVAAVTAIAEVVTATFATDILNVARAWTTGEKFRLTTTSALPDPLVVATDYYAIYVSASQIRVAASRALAVAGTYITLTDAGTGVHTAVPMTALANVYQQSSISEYLAGVGNGVTSWLEIPLADQYILKDTIVVTINSVQWTKVDTLVNSISTDKHYLLIYETDETAKLRFGNGVYGVKPGSFNIYVKYAVGGGANSNVSIEKVIVYGGGDADVELITNLVAFTGGSNIEDIEVARRLAPILLKSRDRFVTDVDGEALALAYGGLSQVRVNPNVYGVLSAQVLGVASGGGNPSAPLKAAIQAYLIERSILESMDIRVEDATITSVAVTCAAKPATGYVFATIKPRVELAWKLFFSETGNEIKTNYISNGIESAVVLINSIFTLSLSASEYTQIVTLLDALEPRNFGDIIQLSDALGYVDQNVIGLDYITLTIPSFPVTLVADEITTNGTITVTEIT